MSAFDRHIGHRTHYTRDSIGELLEESGFQVEQSLLAGFPFFNLYRLMVIARGKKLIADVEAQSTGLQTLAVRAMMKLFAFLFRFNLRNSRFGWQVIAVAWPAGEASLALSDRPGG